MPLLKDRPYLTLDDFDLRTAADADPEALVSRAESMVLDEVRRARNLLIAVKRAVDDDPLRTPGRFVLTGSANLLMLQNVSETLAGRAVYVTLWPLTRRERLGRGTTGVWSSLLKSSHGEWRDVLASDATPPEDWRSAARLGGLPVPAHALAGEDDRTLWSSGYVQARRPEVLYWRTASGLEVDFVIETPARLLPIEVKAAARVTPADAKALEAFLDEYSDQTDGALLLHGGLETFPLARRVLAAPWWKAC